MKTRILTSIFIAATLATSTAQAAANPSVEVLGSGLSTAATQQKHQTETIAQQVTERKSTCKWDEEKDHLDPLYMARLRGEHTC